MSDEDAARVEVIEVSIGEYDPHGSKAQANIRSSFLEAIRKYEVETPSPESSKSGRQCSVMTKLNGMPFQCFQSLYESSDGYFNDAFLRWNTFIYPRWREIFNRGSLAQVGAPLGLRPFQELRRINILSG
jgi:hypothetical protein